ncbi:MAG: ABC transporter ATP-binding protein [Nitrospirae bacterium]|nr:MAG: ABC transporter ATP-binding protein [Nitrospirota bacterium]
MINIEGLNKTYKIGKQVIRAVKDVYLSIKRGTFVSIVGHSGSGKTTLLNLIGGLTKPDSGVIKIDDIPIWDLKDSELSKFRNKKIGFIFQFSSLIPTLTALDNVVLPVLFGGKVDSSAYKRGEYLLKLVGLSDRLNAYPSTLSGGQQRRVAIARAFINNPSLILADEPTGDLDVDTEAEVMALFKMMNREKNVTFIMVTHNPSLAEDVDVRLKMDRGVLKEM